MDSDTAKEGTKQIFVRVDMNLEIPEPYHNTYGYSFYPTEPYQADAYWVAVRNVCEKHRIQKPFWQAGSYDKLGWQYFEFLMSPTTDEFASTLIDLIEEIHTEAESVSEYLRM